MPLFLPFPLSSESFAHQPPTIKIHWRQTIDRGIAFRFCRYNQPIIFIIIIIIMITTSSNSEPLLEQHTEATWIRGVNLGGWLVLERFITPYLFAVTSCHIRGNYCWYPGQLSAPPSYTPCDLFSCKPHLLSYPSGTPVPINTNNNNLTDLFTNASNTTTTTIMPPPPTITTTFVDYPVDSWTLMSSFDSPKLAADYLNVHYENFLTFDHLKRLKEQGGVNYIRVPLPHWILQNDTTAFTNSKNDTTTTTLPPQQLNAYGEPYVAGNMWFYFRRMVQWCDELNIQVWPDLHTAPGSQNGFDNSGHWNPQEPTCHGWSSSPTQVSRTLDLLQGIVQQIVADNMTHVVTGFGILNEPFKDCPPAVMQDYNRRAIQIVKRALGPNVSIYIADNFNATLWNNKRSSASNHDNNNNNNNDADLYWNEKDPQAAVLFHNTFLDSHYYHGKEKERSCFCAFS